MPVSSTSPARCADRQFPARAALTRYRSLSSYGSVSCQIRFPPRDRFIQSAFQIVAHFPSRFVLEPRVVGGKNRWLPWLRGYCPKLEQSQTYHFLGDRQSNGFEL